MIYYKIFGFEIWEVFDGNIYMFVVGVGLGGIFVGIVFFLKEKNLVVKIVIVELEGFILNGGELYVYKIEGIGMEFIFDYMNESYFDEIYIVIDENVFRFVKEVVEKEGLLIGSFLGVVFYVVLEEVKKVFVGINIVIVFFDSSD